MRWLYIVYKLRAQSPIRIDFTKFSSMEEAKKFFFGRLFRVIGGGIRTVMVPEASSNQSNNSFIYKYKSVVTNVVVSYSQQKSFFLLKCNTLQLKNVYFIFLL